MTEPRTEAGKTLREDRLAASDGADDLTEYIAAIEDEASELDTEWAAVERALPEGMTFRGVRHRIELGPNEEWEASVGPDPVGTYCYGPTPAAALRSLREALEGVEK